jgi:hypothetical protein
MSKPTSYKLYRSVLQIAVYSPDLDTTKKASRRMPVDMPEPTGGEQ